MLIIFYFCCFQVHVTESTNIPDHCIHHSLSDDKNANFSVYCNHEHDYTCLSCAKITLVLDKIKSALCESSKHSIVDQYDDMQYTVEQAVLAIHAWKSHQL